MSAIALSVRANKKIAAREKSHASSKGPFTLTIITTKATAYGY